MWRLHADAHAVNNTYVYSKFNVVTATIFFLRKLNNYIYRKKLFKMSNSTMYFLFININKYIYLTNFKILKFDFDENKIPYEIVFSILNVISQFIYNLQAIYCNIYIYIYYCKMQRYTRTQCISFES